jgi:hypothetical protein
MMEKTQPFKQMFLGKVVISQQKSETTSMLVSILVSTQSGLRTLISDQKPLNEYRREA